ncbi:MAG: hypothetical protein IKQ29_01410 [Bacilli bacterium]|nr:hypothetical protein [Bacilli bacterium]
MEKKVSKNKVKKTENKVGKRKEKIYYATTEQKDVKSFLIVILVVLCCVGLIYLATRAFVTKDLFNKDDEEEVVTPVNVNYDKAIVGNMLGKPEKEYYVVVYDMTGDYMADMSSLVSSYNAKEKHLHIYTVDLSNKLNADYYDAENENVKGTSVEDFKFGDITLVKVVDGKVKSYITDYTKMKKELGV